MKPYIFIVPIKLFNKSGNDTAKNDEIQPKKKSVNEIVATKTKNQAIISIKAGLSSQ